MPSAAACSRLSLLGLEALLTFKRWAFFWLEQRQFIFLYASTCWNQKVKIYSLFKYTHRLKDFGWWMYTCVCLSVSSEHSKILKPSNRIFGFSREYSPGCVTECDKPWAPCMEENLMIFNGRGEAARWSVGLRCVWSHGTGNYSLCLHARAEGEGGRTCG